jgi:four helix bundle protein
MQDPRKLIVYQRSHDLAVATRKATRRFPASGHSDLKQQMKASVESIPLNIAEGCGADTAAEFARFLGISIKSAFELEAQLRLVKDYGILSNRVCDGLTDELVIVRRMLYKLRKRVKGED